MDHTKRPYLIAPKLIEQPTWGGEYIVAYKNWQHIPSLKSAVIGQSYELYGNSTLHLNILDSQDAQFGPEAIGSKDTVNLDTLIKEDPAGMLGAKVVAKTGTVMPLLIKFTQAKGNSFQLHKTPTVEDSRWMPKAESWYFFEKGKITLGLVPNVDMVAYKASCLLIEAHMKELSKNVLEKSMDLDVARKDASAFITAQNPWQYVGVFPIEKGSLIDLSGGGLHHSWEEDPTLPFGNVVYEVQQDVADDPSTIRSFDQGKIKDDGSIRTIHIEDYFRHIDTDPIRNDIANATRKAQGDMLLSTTYYSMDEVSMVEEKTLTITNSFEHIFVKDGDVTIQVGDVSVRVTKGHSCFIPFGVASYRVLPKVPSIILKTFINA
ncbi:MAG: hypothetical protein AAB492_03125 [Patescibacteria group bacterium]